MKKLSVYAAIIGGGAAGMMCAIRAAEKHRNKKIIILEKADRVGKKLLVTGNGRCNLSHTDTNSKSYHSKGSTELINILFENYSSNTVLDCFRDMGLFTRSDIEGRIYPLSNQASSVLDVLRNRMAELGIEELCSVEIKDIKIMPSGYEIIGSDVIVHAEKLVIAAGGKTDYAGRESCSKDISDIIGLPVTPLSPSLSPVKVRGDITRSLKGVRVTAEARLIKNGKLIRSERGEVQFAEGTLSGICIFNLSREANLGGCEIEIDLLPGFGFDEIKAEIRRRISRNTEAPASGLFTGIFHKNIGLALLKSSGIKPSAACEQISKKEINALCCNISGWRFICEANRDFKKAQVTAGGIKLSEIDPHSFESRKHSGLYIIGEALDIDGDCGGYNLQFAFASGMCAGDSL